MIMVLGGTTEARQLVEMLIGENMAVLVSTAYDFAEKFIPKSALIKHISGKLDSKAMLALIRDENIKAIVDAAHPYAVGARKNAKEACKRAGITYLRLERSPCDRESGKTYRRAYEAGSFEQAIVKACELGKNIFIAAGSNEAALFYRETSTRGRKAYIRSLPDDFAVNRCLKAGFLRDEIVTGVGPFSYEDNYRLWKELGIDVVVTKESGVAGGFAEKIRAAKDLGINVVIIKRPPPEQDAFLSAEAVLQAIKTIEAGR